MPLHLDLTKAARSLRLSLDKAGVAQTVKAELIIDIDVSGSFEHEHEEGTTSRLVSRLVPYGMVLDPDGLVDVFTFSGGPDAVHYAGTVTPETSASFMMDRVVGLVPGWNGGTTYSHVLERNLQHFGWLPLTVPPQGFFSRFFGMKPPEAPAPVARKRSIVIFITDGENDASDMLRTARILEASEERGDEVYFLFMGACEHEVEFKFLRQLAKGFSNTGLVIVNDLDAFVELSDEALNSQLLVPELIQWLRT